MAGNPASGARFHCGRIPPVPIAKGPGGGTGETALPILGRRMEGNVMTAIAIRVLKQTSTIAAASMLACALAPSPASAQVIERGIQGGVTGAIIGGIIGGGKGAGRGAAIGAGVGVVAGAIEADQNARARA